MRNVWTRSANGDVWHLGVQRELRGDKTDKLMSVYFVTSCTRKQLGGAWGSVQVDLPADEQPPHVCSRCASHHKAQELLKTFDKRGRKIK
jgi:hypothetical protein